MGIMSSVYGGIGVFREKGQPGSIHVICGCMFAGKTEALIDRVRGLPAGDVCVFKHALDRRYDDTRVVSHNHRSCRAVPVTHSDELQKVDMGNANVVAIDEGHFFDDNFPAVCEQLCTRGLDVIVTTLDLDSWGRPFPMIARLRKLADSVTVKTTQCGKCGGQATRTQRLIPFVAANLVGGAEAFEPRCESCWTPPPEEGDAPIVGDHRVHDPPADRIRP